MTTTNNDNGSKDSTADWEALLDDMEVPPELARNNPHLKAIIKMMKDYCCDANSKILSICKYFKQELDAQSDNTLAAIQLQQ